MTHTQEDTGEDFLIVVCDKTLSECKLGYIYVNIHGM